MEAYDTLNGQPRNVDAPAPEQYYSVEFSIRDLKLLYQFKIWNSSAESMFIIVKEGSGMLPRLKTGCTYKTKYYTTDTGCPTIDAETRIREITRDEGGRFKGHYLIGLDLLCARGDRLGPSIPIPDPPRQAARAVLPV